MGALIQRALVLLLAFSVVVADTEEQPSKQNQETQPNYQVGRVIRQIFGRSK